MTTGRYTRLAARVLARGLSDDAPAPSKRARAEAIEAIEGALRLRARRRQRMRWLAVGSIAAAALLAIGGGYALLRGVGSTAAPVASTGIRVIGHPSGRGALVLGGGSDGAALTDGGELGAGARVVARADGQALLSLSTGTRLLVEEGGDLAVRDPGPAQRFVLRAGGVRADVAKLRRGQRFVIGTPDAEVEVHGTSFRVSVVPPRDDCAGGARTRVVVYEGVVTVRHAGATAQLHAGDRWPAGCAEPSAASEPTRPAAVAGTDPGGPAGADEPRAGRTSARGRLPEHPDRSALAAENDAFAQAVALRRSGQSSRAIEAFDRFLARYPRGRLSESAAASRLRLLRSARSPRATEAARRYLSTYPNGLASEEARSILQDR